MGWDGVGLVTTDAGKTGTHSFMSMVFFGASAVLSVSLTLQTGSLELEELDG